VCSLFGLHCQKNITLLVSPNVAPSNPLGPWFQQIWIPNMSESYHVNLSFSGLVVIKKIFKRPPSFCIFVIISPFNRVRPSIRTILNPLYLRMVCIKFHWNWPAHSGEDFLKFSVHFYSFAIIFPWRKGLPFIWTILNPLHLRMICANVGYSRLGGYGEVENVNV
jgi:hypothetical protein